MRLWPCEPEKLLTDLRIENGLLLFNYLPDRAIRLADSSSELLYRGTKTALSRVIWCLTHRDWPNCQLKHLDGNKRNNLPSNLALNPNCPIRGFEETRRALESDKLWLAPRTRPLFSAKTYKESEV